MPPVNPPRGTATDSSGAQVAGGTGFSLDGFMSDLAEQNKLRAAREAEQLATAENQKQIMQESARLATEQANSMGFMKQDFEIARQKTEHARSLQDGSLWDNLRLAGLQIMDPAGYDPVERSKRLQEDSQQAALLSQYYGYQQGALQSKLQASTANLDYLKQLEAIGHEKLTAFADSAALLHQNISAMNSMRQDAVQNLDDTQIATAIAQAQRSPTKTVNIAGVDVDVGTLTDRQTALYDRSFANLAKKNALALAQDDASHIDDVLANREYQRTLDADLRKNVGIDLQIKNAERTNQARQLVEQAQEREVRTLNLNELQTLRNNNYKSAAGEQYNPQVVEQAYSLRKQAEQSQIEDALQQNALKNFDLSQVATERTRIQASLGRFKPGTPVAAAAQEYYNALGVTAVGIGPENGPVTRITAMQGFATAKDKYDKTLQAQAVLDGKGDKNLTELRLEWYRGNPIPQETLTNAATERLTKFKSVADLFPADVAPKIEKKYRELIQQSQQRNPWDGSMTEADKKVAQADAAQKAIDYGVNQALAGQSDVIVASQVMDPTHPLYGKMTPTQFASYTAQADANAYQQWQKQNNISDDEAKQIDAGIPVAGKPDIPTLISNRKYLENVNLLQTLDSFQPGLGHEMTQWWAEKGQNYINNISSSLGAQANGSFQATNLSSQTSDTMSNAFMQYAATLQQSDSTYQQEFSKRNADLLTFGSSPENAQIAVLTQTPGLSNTERKQIFGTVIRPLLDQAAKKGMDFQQTNEYVESQIQNYVPQTPAMKELMRITRKDRPEVLKQMNSWKAMFGRFLNSIEPGGALDQPEDTSWYKEWQRGQNQDQQQPTPSKTPWILTYRK